MINKCKFYNFSILCILTFGTITLTEVPVHGDAPFVYKDTVPFYKNRNEDRKIHFIYDSLNFSISLKSLNDFAKEGKLTDEINLYFDVGGITVDEKASFREILKNPILDDLIIKNFKIPPSVSISRILNTDEGLRILDYFGSLINIQGGCNGKHAIRGALVKSVIDAEKGTKEVSLLSILNNLAVDIEINLKDSLAFDGQIELIREATTVLGDEISKLSEIEANNNLPINSYQLDPEKFGNFGVSEVSKDSRWYLTNKERHTLFRERRFYVDTYRPKIWRDGKTPVVIISHGLMSHPKEENFVNIAKHLASYGYFVVLPQHIGSDRQQGKDFYDGLSRQIFLLEEFVDRPLDISQTLDELEKRNDTEFQGKLDLKNVGLLGHSFGGYTALAVAGATPDFEYLKKDCSSKLSSVNISLLLQCRALQIEQRDYNFRDERIQAIYAMNPVNASIFGSQGLKKIEIPTFIGSGSKDIVTPLVFEQALPFSWLTTENSYLLLQMGQTHGQSSAPFAARLDEESEFFIKLDGGFKFLLEKIKNFQDILIAADLVDNSNTGHSELTSSDYTNAMTLAFFEVHINNNNNYLPYLQSSYTNSLSNNKDLKAYLISRDSSEAIREVIKKIKSNYNIFGDRDIFETRECEENNLTK
ncbi:alpha/beta hydrolase [Crocosphaera sp.]|uniref:alpha/beta hydrolase n=1 Tax=Crocosphaera sp. TaxID=2729996 RepID=UPI003F255016|nr:alpha/beta hydrolase [Crocosphaera sp.]